MNPNQTAHKQSHLATYCLQYQATILQKQMREQTTIAMNDIKWLIY